MNTDARVEAHVRRLILAFPWRDRIEHGDEIVDTILATVPSGVSRVPMRTAVDVVRGGMRVRRQRRPPLTTRLRFRWGGLVDPRWLRWVRDEIDHPWFVLRRRMGGTLPLLAFFMVPWLDGSQLFRTVVGVVVALVVVRAVVGWVGRPLGLDRLRVVGPWIARIDDDEAVRRKVRARYGLAEAGVEPSVMWVRIRSKGVPNLVAAPCAGSIGVASIIGALAVMWAAAHEHGASGGASEVALPDVAVRLAGTGVIAAVLGVLAVTWMWRRRHAGATTVTSRVPTAVVSVVGSGAALVSLSSLSDGVTRRDVMWESIGAIAAGLGVALVVLAVLARLAGRRHELVTLWTLVPRLAPRDTYTGVSAATALDWYPEGDRRTAEQLIGPSREWMWPD